MVVLAGAAAPSVVVTAGTTVVALTPFQGLESLGPLSLVVLGAGFVLNMFCSGFAARDFVEARSPDPYEQRGAVGWFILFFVTNLILSFGGCALASAIGSSIRR
jgi:hypothetical protein